jgi:glucokinase
VLPIAHSARRGESAGRETFAMMGDALGRGLAAVQNLLDLNAIVFTGGISGSFDLITQHVRGGLRAHTFAPPLAEVPLLLSDLGEVAGIIGAAYLTTL